MKEDAESPPEARGATKPGRMDDEVEALRAAIRDLELGEQWERRFDGRFLGQLGWMQHYAQKSRRLHQSLQVTVIIAGVTVPALVSLNLAGEAATWVRWLTFALSLIAAVT